MSLFVIAPIGATLALAFAYYLYNWVMKQPEGSEKMKEIAGYVREGAYAYLRKQYKVVTILFAILFGIFLILAYLGIQNPFVSIAFLTGGFFSGLCGYLGMKTATAASSRTAQGATKSLNKGLKVSFRAGAVMGLVVVGFGLLDISIWYWLLNNVFFTSNNMANGLVFAGLNFVPAGMDPATKQLIITATMITFGMGASTQALFARVGGGIFTKAADVGADLVGKIEKDIPEDDPRNPATIADNVGDNVGDVAGMGADLYESYCGSILATMALGAALGLKNGLAINNLVLAPMIVAGIGIIMSILGIFMVRTKEKATQKDLLKSLLTGTLGSSVFIVVALLFIAKAGLINWGIFGSIISGLITGVIIGQITEYFTSAGYKPTQQIAEQAKLGTAPLIIKGISVGMYSTGPSVITVVLGIMTAFYFSNGFCNLSQGLYGIGFAAVGMLSTLGITLATDAYGPIADNAGGNAEMSGLPPEVRERTDALDSLGNTTAATGKGFAIGSAALTALALLATLQEEVKIWLEKLAYDTGTFTLGQTTLTLTEIKNMEIMDIVNLYNMSIMNPKLIGGIFIGAATAFTFAALCNDAVGRTADQMVKEVRRQFKTIPGIMKGENKPDYARCVEISTQGAQKEMIFPSFLALSVPVIIGLLLGVAGLIGLLTGALATSFTLAIFLNNAGGSFDNAKKYIEAGNFGGKGSDAHKAAVTGDTVGDPFKDTSGPALNILIKLMMMSAIVFSGVIIKYSPLIGEHLKIGF